MEAPDTTESSESELPPGTYLRVRQVAAYFDVGLSTIYDLIEAGVLPAVGIGTGEKKKTLRVHRDDVDAYERNLRQTPQATSA
ncbi:helix-turn-helix domain-containing protein [Streptomyces sp. NPDC001073]